MKKKKIKILFIITLIIIITYIPSTSVPIVKAQRETNAKPLGTLLERRTFGNAPSYLQPGDIVCCEVWDIWVKLLNAHDASPEDPYGFDHIAIYMGKGTIKDGKFVSTDIGRDYVIEATFFPGNKVRYTPLLLLQLYSRIYYAKVKDADESVKQKAIDFAESKLGDRYQHFLSPFYTEYQKLFRWHANWNASDNGDPLSNRWYCAELVWASYFIAGIDLDDKFPDDHDKDGIQDFVTDYGLLRFVSPKNIYLSVNTTRY
jgi:hypothetical protein